MADKPKIPNSNNSIDLTKAYQVAEQTIINSLKGQSPQIIKQRFTKTLQTVAIELNTLNANALEKEVNSGIYQSQNKFINNLASIFNGRAFTVKDLTASGLDIKNQKVAADILERKANDSQKTAVYRQNFLELRGRLVGVTQGLQHEVNATLHKLADKDANTVSAAINELTERLKANGCLSVKYGNGAQVGVDKYATMVCRSARTESANAENLRMSKEFGTDLVECIGNAVTCDVCAQYRGRIFSVSGEDKRYPPLRDGPNSPLKNGYDLIHPNCRCEFRAYFEVLHSNEENAKKQVFSNRPFEGDKRTTAQARAYQEWQNIMRRANDEQYRWDEMKAVLGKDMQYSNLGSLRRALRSDKESLAYKKSHYAVRDYNQYNRWKETIGKENMPESLADFQDLKYNNSTKFDSLQEYKEYVVENPKASPVDHKRAVELKQKGVKGNIHIPPKELVHIEELSFDDYHINTERKHGVKEQEAKQLIKEAKISKTVWNGQYERYYGEKGASYVDIENNIIRTSFKVEQYDDDSNIILGVIQQWNKDENQ